MFGGVEKRAFRSILRRLEAFSGVRIVTYCLMGNHFHLLLKVPDKEGMEKLDAGRLLELLPLLYDAKTVESVGKELERARQSGNAEWERAILDRFERRRGDLSMFLKMLKQRFSVFFNRRKERVGTLWEGRFRSVLIEGGEEALRAVAAYIDLNPVRAGLVSRPEDYGWSGYGEACGAGAGARKARLGLGMITREGLENPEKAGTVPWEEVRASYRCLLYTRGNVSENAPDGRGGAPGTGREHDEAGMTENAETAETEATEAVDRPETLAEALRRRIRDFTEGAVIGSADFVGAVAEQLRAEGRLAKRRTGGGQAVGDAESGGLRTLRRVRKTSRAAVARPEG